MGGNYYLKSFLFFPYPALPPNVVRTPHIHGARTTAAITFECKVDPKRRAQERPGKAQERPIRGQEKPRRGQERPGEAQERPGEAQERPGEARGSKNAIVIKNLF